MNTFGSLFRIHIFGESHGGIVGISIDGCPPGIAIEAKDFQIDLGRRKSGAKGSTPRVESDEPRFISGIFNGKSTGAPLTILFENNNRNSKDYDSLIKHPRPGHADFTAMKKYGGFADYRGGGHFSGRLTLPLVAAGVVAKKIIKPLHISAQLTEAGGIADIEAAIEKALASKDSIGGIIECKASNMPIGLGEPFFNSVESLISHLVFSIPAVKGIEFGSGFQAAKMTGSQHNDNILDKKGTTETNNSGGINGGLSNGNDLLFRVAIKPTSSIGSPQQTLNLSSGKVEELQIQGRHDSCIALRVPPVIEAVTAIALADLLMINKAVSVY